MNSVNLPSLDPELRPFLRPLIRDRNESRFHFIGRAAGNEVTVGLATTAALVYAIGSSSLAIGSLVCYPLTDRPLNFFGSHAQAAWILTGLGSSALALYPTLVVIAELRDLGPLFDQLMGPSNNSELIDQGANFIRNDILRNAPHETMQAFEEMNPRIFQPILTKAVYIYTSGPRKNDPIPDFFQEKTKDSIQTLRQENNSPAVIEEIERLIEAEMSLSEADLQPQSATAKTFLQKLRRVGSEEQQGSIFLTTCYQKALEQDR